VSEQPDDASQPFCLECECCPCDCDDEPDDPNDIYTSADNDAGRRNG
jgi:hypothetical protein